VNRSGANDVGSEAAAGCDPAARYQHLVENIQDAVVEFEFVDDEPIVRDVNEAFEEIFGYDRETILGESLNAWIVPEEQNEAAREIDRHTERGEVTSHRLTRETADGSREFLHRSVPYDGSGIVDGIALYTDITEQRRAEQKRQLLTETTRCIGEAETLCEGFETTLETICAYTEWTYGEVWRPTTDCEELTFTAGHADDPASELFLAESEDKTFVADEGLPGRVYQSGTSEWIPDVSQVGPEVFQRTNLATEIGLRAAFGAPVVADGQVVAVLTFFLREYRDSDDRLAAHVTDIARSLGELVARKQAEELVKHRNEQLEQFADVISHDLRNPLNVAMTHLELAADTGDSDHLGRVATAHDRMAELIDDVLALARQGQAVDDSVAVALDACAHRSWGMTDTGGADLSVETTRMVCGDESRIRRLFTNLFRNAVEHGSTGSQTDTEGTADVTVSVGDTPCGFYVADDGPGIAEGDREAVFELGHTTQEGGTGLGLPIVREIAEAHGWSVSVTDSEMGGARFEFAGVDGPSSAPGPPEQE
jgi:PAS domain S-box-containing protein